jgi:hypothetical protein
MNISLQRSVSLKVFLILTVALSLIGLAAYPFAWKAMLAIYPAWTVYVLLSISLLRLFSVFAIWRWSKSGVVLYIFLTALAIPITFYTGIKISWLGIIGCVILVLLIRKSWRHMQWGLVSNYAIKGTSVETLDSSELSSGASVPYFGC